MKEIQPKQIWNEEKIEGVKKLIQKQKLIDMMEQDEQLGLYEEPKYPIGGYAPGNYMCNCSTCKTQFQGDKRAVQCEPCAIKMTKEESKLDCKDCSQSLQVCTCIEDTIDMKQSTKDRILSETSEEIKQKVRDTANKLVMKQETLEEAAERLYPTTIDSFTDNGIDLSERERLIFINGAKWQIERSYSEEEVDVLISLLKGTTEYEVLQSFRDKVEQFKKK